MSNEIVHFEIPATEPEALKKFYRDPGGRIRLQPANAAMQPIFIEPDQVQIQGVVVGVMRKY